MDWSTVFVVSMMTRFTGTPNFSLGQYGSVTLISLAAPNRLSGSINVINSPNSFEMFPWLNPKAHGVNLVNHQRVRVRRVLLRPPAQPLEHAGLDQEEECQK
jgi:hypothetical protein